MESSSSLNPKSENQMESGLQELRLSWDQFKNGLKKGEPCIELLTEFKSKALKYPSLEAQLVTLESFAQNPAKSAALLYENLEKIYQAIKDSPVASEKVSIPDSHGFLGGFLKYLSRWIKIERLNNKGEEVSVTIAFEKALQSLAKNELGQTIDYLKSLPSMVTINEWLVQAEQRQQCERLINEMDKLVVQTMKG